jgi:hypothetical protein
VVRGLFVHDCPVSHPVGAASPIAVC